MDKLGKGRLICMEMRYLEALPVQIMLSQIFYYGNQVYNFESGWPLLPLLRVLEQVVFIVD